MVLKTRVLTGLFWRRAARQGLQRVVCSGSCGNQTRGMPQPTWQEYLALSLHRILIPTASQRKLAAFATGSAKLWLSLGAGAALALCSRCREVPRSQVAEAGYLTERLASILMKQPLGLWSLSPVTIKVKQVQTVEGAPRSSGLASPCTILSGGPQV